MNEKMTALIADILQQFEAVKKEAQRSLITMPDILVKRQQVLACIEMITANLFAGGKEEAIPVWTLYLKNLRTIAPVLRGHRIILLHNLAM